MIELTREGGEKILLRLASIILVTPVQPGAREGCKAAVTFEIGQACIVEYVQESVASIQERL